MQFTTFDSLYDSVPHTYEGWDTFLQAFELRITPDKQAVPLYSPAVFLPGTTKRTEINLLHVSFGVIDVDKATREQVDQALYLLYEQGYGFICHSTHSHVDGLRDGLFKCRIIVPLNRPVHFDEWDRVWTFLNGILDDIGDPKCKNPNAIYFFPSSPPGAEQYAFIWTNLGRPLEVEIALDLVPVDSVKTSFIPDIDPELLTRIKQSTKFQIAESIMLHYPPAIEGQHGDDQTFQAATIGGDCDLKDEEFWPLLLRWNERCQPAWSHEELWRKLENAYKYRKKPRGWRLIQQGTGDYISKGDLEKLGTKLAQKEGQLGTIGRLLRTMVAGDPVQHGEQTLAAIEDLAEWLGEHYVHADAERLAEHLEPSLAATRASGIRDATLALVIERMKGAQSRVLAEQSAEASRNQKQRTERIRTAFQRIGMHRLTPYSREELEYYAGQAGLSVEGFQNRWIIRKNKSVYFFVGGQYLGPYAWDETQNAAHELLLPAGLSLWTRSRSGARALSSTELINQYGNLADSIVADLTAQKSYFDERTSTLVEAPCPLRPIMPAYSEYVAHWLRLLTEDDQAYERLLDWLACLPMLQSPIAALYLHGYAATGKTLLAESCARLWTDDGPTSIFDITGNFNSCLTECPLIFADETVPVDSQGQPQTDLLRRIIQEHSRTLKRKFRDDAKIRGSIRLVMAANNPDLIVGTRMHLTNKDIGAINERFLCIPVTTTKAKDFLQNLPMDVDVAMKKGTMIPAHALWLSQNRTVKYAGRLLVEGIAGSELEMRMLTSTGLRSEVCNWIASYVTNPERLAVDGRRPITTYDKNGAPILIINAKILHTHWRTYCQDAVSIGAIEKALGGLCTERMRHPEGWFRKVDMNRIKYWAEVNGHASDIEFDTGLAKLGLARSTNIIPFNR